jgi:hypothetical protein
MVLLEDHSLLATEGGPSWLVISAAQGYVIQRNVDRKTLLQ